MTLWVFVEIFAIHSFYIPPAERRSPHFKGGVSNSAFFSKN